MDPLRLALLLLTIGEPPPDNAAQLARDALDGGHDVAVLRRLAEGERISAAEAGEALDGLAADRGWPGVDETGARLELVKYWAGQIVTNQLPAIDGARLIAEHGAARLGDRGDLRAFTGLVRDWEESPEGREGPERRILEAATMLHADTA